MSRAAQHAADARYYRTLGGRASRLLASAKRRAIVTVDRAWVVERLQLGRCQRTAKRFVLESGRGVHPFAPSLDRINPKGDYTPENTQLVCWQYNAAKSTFTDPDVVRFARAVIDVAEGRLDPTTGFYKEID